MRDAAPLLLLSLAVGCATAPDRLCDLERSGLSVITNPPPESQALLAQLREELPAALDESRLHGVWLESGVGDLYLCTYRRRPVVTRSCGVTVYRYTKTADGYQGETISVAAC